MTWFDVALYVTPMALIIGVAAFRTARYGFSRETLRLGSLMMSIYLMIMFAFLEFHRLASCGFHAVCR